jgi:betaine-aldehyde dehydrogenase
MTAPSTLLIGDTWRVGRGGSFDSINPADGSVAARFSIADESDVADAVAAARQAFQAPGWRSMRGHLRARLLHRFADLIEGAQQDLAAAQSSDNGKTLAECRTQALQGAGVFRYFASLCETVEGQLTPQRAQSVTMAVYEPAGVVAAITPWNSPLTLEAQKLAPALAAGNAVVLKPSEVTSQVALIYGRLALEAGFPPGIVGIVTGLGDTGRALVNHPDVDLISFTGGTMAGRAIAEAAGRRLCPVILELGGKSPNMVFDDAQFDAAVAGAASGIFGSGGQSCIAGSRIFVQSTIYERFVDALVEKAKDYRPGMPDDPTARIGPMASFPHRDSVAAAVDRARAEGATVRCGGAAPEDPRYANGAFYMPTVLTGLENTSATSQQEIFGPVCVVMPFEDEADLLAMANDTDFGLAAGVWTEDSRKAWRVARAVRAGTVWINGYKEGSISTPFGGVGHSGIGREKGLAGLRAYCEPKGIFWRLED